jgi:predicted permease
MYASANYFQVLGARTVLGRTYSAAEDRLGQGAPVAVISHAFWTIHLAGDSAALGRPIAIGPDEYTVIGILDPSFTGIDLRPASVWLPMGTRSGSPQEGERWWETNASFGFRAIARIEAGVNVGAFEQRASHRVRAMMRQAARPDSIVDVHTGSLIEARGPGRRGQQVEIALRLGGVAFIVLIIACANATNLLLARAVRRRREIAVRLALGISRWRLVRLLTLETMLIAMIAAVVAMLAGWWGGSLLRSLLMSGLEVPSMGLHWRVMLFTGAVALLAGVAAGVVPALQASNPGLTTALKAGARDGMQHRSRLRRGLVIAQAALSVVLLVGAGLFVRSLHNVQGLDIGYDASRLLFGNVVFDEGGAPPASVVDAALRQLAGRLDAHPAIEAVARTNFMPMGGVSMLLWYAGSDSTGAFGPRDPAITYVSPSFFQTTGIAVVRGSGLSGTDTGEPPAEVVVNDAAARLLWAGRDPIGACVHFTARENPCHVVVGVVQDVPKMELLESERGAQFYLPLGSPPSRGLTPGVTGGTIVVRARPDAALTAAAELASALRQSFPFGYPTVTPMRERLEPEYRPWQLGAALFTAFGLLALLVAVVGIYSTVSYGVSQRTHEFGVRIALGARIRDVLRQVLGEGLRTVAIGIAFGVVLALAAGRMIASLLYGVEPSDPAVLLLVTASLLFVAMLAALLPAWRAARVDPVTALREE